MSNFNLNGLIVISATKVCGYQKGNGPKKFKKAPFLVRIYIKLAWKSLHISME